VTARTRLVRRLASVVCVVTLSSACSTQPPPAADGRTPVWLDVDPAIGEPDGDVDDALALIQAFRSDTLVVRGVSAVFGNAPLVRTWPITQDLVARFGPEGMRPWRGASGSHEGHAPTEASEALATALRAERLTVIALGPLTNIASVLQRDARLLDRIERIVAVAGRRPGHASPVDESTRHGNGDGDPNVARDVDAMQVVLESGVPLTLVSRELSAGVWIDGDDLARLGEGPVAARFLAESSKDWLRRWQDTLGARGFPIADPFAVDIVAAPGKVSCVAAGATLERTPASAASPSPAETGESGRAAVVAREGGTGRPVTYCHTADEGFKERLLTTLLRDDSRQ
jgi:pyrimidine-specific ribonucleoside hydrolase